MKNDREIVLAAVRQNGIALKYASNSLKNDELVVLTAVQQDGYALKYASSFENVSVARASKFGNFSQGTIF